MAPAAFDANARAAFTLGNRDHWHVLRPLIKGDIIALDVLF